MTVYIDADACPVTKIAVEIASEYNIKCILVCDTSHMMSLDNAETIIVSEGSDSADIALVNKISQNDIVVTQDYGLACMCLGKGAYVINQNGIQYTNNNIIYLMETRHEAKKLRMRGQRLKGQKPRTKEQNEKFKTSFRNLIVQVLLQ